MMNLNFSTAARLELNVAYCVQQRFHGLRTVALLLSQLVKLGWNYTAGYTRPNHNYYDCRRTYIYSIYKYVLPFPTFVEHKRNL